MMPHVPCILFITDPYIEHLLEGVVDFARERHWGLNAMMRRSGRFPEGVRPAGVIATVEHDDTARRIARFRCPVVQMLRIRPEVRYPLVIPDYAALGEKGAQHLLTLGRPQFAFYRRFEAIDSNAVRNGFLRTMHDAGCDVTMLDFPEDMPRRAATDKVWEMRLMKKLHALPKPCAIMAEDDRCGAQIIRLALQEGLRVPEDIAVVGCDNHSPDVNLSPVPLTSVDSHLRGIGYAAAELLQRLMNGERPPKEPIVVPPHGIIERASTAAFACADKRIAETVRRIRRDFAEPLTVSTLAHEAAMSVRALQTGFKAATGHSLRDELIRCRLTRAERLLEESELKIQTVAIECGLGDAKSLTRFFHQKHGQTPNAYRQAFWQRRVR
ncbi:MAG: substrate-binding domain-containing protein [Prosthecobacter sp.]|uniref:substrate-binding domain-containing protein n=1 Tax=Prosthecobacter sp. TaxID=1965333 RepID=UPI00261146E6|nr:substrate-binding domain-containing protein [Prosthecobacter sp.]MCF7789244.1 substrate-binding domain-containing protein [Prosthecobacter sp.]